MFNIISKNILSCCFVNFNCFLLLQTAVLTVAVLPLRVLAIVVLLVLAWLLACIGLIGVSEEDLRTKPMTGWRK